MCSPVAAQVMRKSDLIRKNMVQSVKNERNILAMANNPFVVRAMQAQSATVVLMPRCSTRLSHLLRTSGWPAMRMRTLLWPGV